MLRHNRESRLFRAGYKHSPQVCYIASCVLIGVLLCSTLWTDELLACSLSTFTADMAGLRSIGRVNENNTDTFALGLVLDKGAKLIERPRVMQSSLCFPQLLVCSFPDMCQVFKGNGGILGHGLVDYLTTNPVVDAFLIARLASLEPCRESATTPPRGSRTTACFQLHRPANLRPAQSVGRHFVTRKLCAVRKDGEINHSHINADYYFGRQVDRIRVFNNDVDKVVFALFAECGASGILAGKGFSLISTDGQWKAIPAACQCEADDPILFLEREDAKIVVNACGTEDAVAGFLLHQSGRDTSNGADSEISGQAEPGANILVTQAMQFKLTPDLVLAPIVGDVIARSGEGGQCSVNLIGAMDDQFTLDSSYAHREYYLTMLGICQ